MANGTFETWMVEVMSGRQRGIGAGLTRAALGLVEPAYAGVASARNRRFDRNAAAARRLGRPVISVGNLTTGGTGKTPAVQWLVRALLARGHRPGILLRGYRKAAGVAASDEEHLLRETLSIPVVANPDRAAGARALLAANPEVSVIVLDDGFQHRRVARDLDVVLIDCTNPFGFDHVLPRGLLREPVGGLARAGVIVLTRVDQVSAEAVAEIEARARLHNAAAPIVRSVHRLTHAVGRDGQRVELEALRGKRAFALSAIGNPAAFERSLQDAGMIVCGSRRFADHHAYQPHDLYAMTQTIIQWPAGAEAKPPEMVVTTEKDWVKLAGLGDVAKLPVPFLRIALELSFEGDGDTVVFGQVLAAIEAAERGRGS